MSAGPPRWVGREDADTRPPVPRGVMARRSATRARQAAAPVGETPSKEGRRALAGRGAPGARAPPGGATVYLANP